MLRCIFGPVFWRRRVWNRLNRTWMGNVRGSVGHFRQSSPRQTPEREELPPRAFRLRGTGRFGLFESQ